jgi:glycosyltransferase involved in cell wall biosynthesis
MGKKNKLNLLIVNRTLSMVRGGGELRDLAIGNEMSKRGHSVSILTGCPMFKNKNYTTSNIKQKNVMSPWLHRASKYINGTHISHLRIGGLIRRVDEFLFRMAAWRRITKEIDTYNVFQCFGLGMAPLAYKIEKNGKPTILVLSADSKINRYKRKIKQLSGVLAIGKAINHVPDAANKKEMGEVIPEYFRTDKKIKTDFYKKEKLNKDANVISYAGRLIDSKGVDLMMETVNEVIKKRPQTYLYVAGKGPKEGFIHKFCKQAGISSNVKVLGSIERNKMKNLYNASDLLILPSKKESFSMVVAEAISCGTPVVSADVGRVDRFIRDGKDGIIVQSRSPKELCKAVIKVIDKNANFSRQARNRSQYVQNKYSPEKIVDGVENFMYSLMN